MVYGMIPCRYYVSTKHEQSMVQAMEEGDDAVVRRLLNGAVEAFKAELRKQGSTVHCIYVWSGGPKVSHYIPRSDLKQTILNFAQ